MGTEVGMYPVIEDKWGGIEAHWRQVQLRVGEAMPFEYSNVTWRLVGWLHRWNDVSVHRVLDHGRTRVTFKIENMGFDLSAHTAFCRGDMPGPVYADWLEENVRDFPAVGLALLRGWIDHQDLR